MAGEPKTRKRSLLRTGASCDLAAGGDVRVVVVVMAGLRKSGSIIFDQLKRRRNRLAVADIG
jgi:hypothetical protein